MAPPCGSGEVSRDSSGALDTSGIMFIWPGQDGIQPEEINVAQVVVVDTLPYLPLPSFKYHRPRRPYQFGRLAQVFIPPQTPHSIP